MIDADQRSEQDAAGSRHSGTDGKHDSVHLRHRNTHGLRHDAVLRGCADPDAVAAVFEEQIEPGDDGSRERRDHDSVPGILQVEERELAGEGFLDLAGYGPELPQRIVLQHQ